jgi:hypothetical protein
VLGVRDGALLVDRGRFAVDESITLSALTATSLSCSVVTVTWNIRDEASDAREWIAMGLPPALGTRYLPAGAPLALTAEPGGAPVAQLAPVEYERTLQVIEVRGEDVRLVLVGFTGAVIVGWAPAAAVTTESGDSGERGLLGLLGTGAAETLRVCHLNADVSIVARRVAAFDPDTGESSPVAPGAPITIGTAAAGSRVVVLSIDGDEAVIEPARDQPLQVGNESEWRIPAAAIESAVCAEEVWDPNAALREAFGDAAPPGE